MRAFLRLCAATGTEPEPTRVKVQTFVADMLVGGAEAATTHCLITEKAGGPLSSPFP